MNLEAIKNSAMQRRKISEAEKAELIANDGPAFWAFLIQQNPQNINDTLRYKLGFNHLPPTPDPVKMGHVIGRLIEAGHVSKVQAILDNYKFKPGTAISAKIKQALNNRFK